MKKRYLFKFIQINLVRFSNIVRFLLSRIFFLSPRKTNYTFNRLQFDIATSPLHGHHFTRTKGKALSFYSTKLIRIGVTYMCVIRMEKKREKWKWCEMMHTRCVSSTFSKSCYLYSWLHELKERSRSGFLNMAAGRPRAVIQSRFFQLDQTVALFSVCSPGATVVSTFLRAFVLAPFLSALAFVDSSLAREDRILYRHFVIAFRECPFESVIHRLS